MMGEHSGNQDRLFYSFNLDEHVPADHLLRGIDRFLDLSDLRQHLAALAYEPHGTALSRSGGSWCGCYWSATALGIRSERRLCEEVHLKPGVSLVLPTWTRRHGSRSLELLEEPAWPFPRERCVPARV